GVGEIEGARHRYDFAGHGGDGLDGSQLRPDGGALSVRWLGIYLRGEGTERASWVPRRLGNASGLSVHSTVLRDLWVPRVPAAASGSAVLRICRILRGPDDLRQSLGHPNDSADERDTGGGHGNRAAVFRCPGHSIRRRPPRWKGLDLISTVLPSGNVSLGNG